MIAARDALWRTQCALLAAMQAMVVAYAVLYPTAMERTYITIIGHCWATDGPCWAMVVAYAVGVSAQLIVADLWRKRHDEPTLIQLAMTATWWTALDVCIGMIGAKSPAGAASQWMRVSFWLCFTLYYIVANVQNVRTASAPACPKARRMHAQPDEAPCEAG